MNSFHLHHLTERVPLAPLNPKLHKQTVPKLLQLHDPHIDGAGPGYAGQLHWRVCTHRTVKLSTSSSAQASSATRFADSNTSKDTLG